MEDMEKNIATFKENNINAVRTRSNYENLKNHTAILFWSLGNESFAGDNLAAMNKFYKEHNDSRLIHYEGVCHTHNYSQ
jgi:beta-galactosidase